jgi:hypothetical protein
MSSQPRGLPTFLEHYLNGKAVAEDIDDFIDVWHENLKQMEIYEFLGMTKEEYSLWLRDPDTLPQIARARRLGLPLVKVVSIALKELPTAARSAEKEKVRRLRRWLEQAEKTE